MPNSPTPRRRNLRLSEYDYSHPGAYFVTLCTHGKRCLFGHVVEEAMVLNAFGEVAHTIWKHLPARYPGTELDAFVVMPNHVHGIIAIIDPEKGSGSQAPDPETKPPLVGAIHELPLRNRMERRQMLLPKMIGYYKMNVSKRINRLRGTPGSAVWQRNYWERVVRNERELHAYRRYIAENPARWFWDRYHPDRR